MYKIHLELDRCRCGTMLLQLRQVGRLSAVAGLKKLRRSCMFSQKTDKRAQTTRDVGPQSSSMPEPNHIKTQADLAHRDKYNTRRRSQLLQQRMRGSNAERTRDVKGRINRCGCEVGTGGRYGFHFLTGSFRGLLESLHVRAGSFRGLS